MEWYLYIHDNYFYYLNVCFSAGIGRTGTYIALDNAYYQAKKEGTVRILDVVQSLREQRVKMVQTKVRRSHVVIIIY